MGTGVLFQLDPAHSSCPAMIGVKLKIKQLTLESLVSGGTFGIHSLKSVKAVLILCVLRLSFLLAVVLLLTTRTKDGGGLSYLGNCISQSRAKKISY